MQHSHPVELSHGTRNAYVVGCGACDAMRAEVTTQRAAYSAALAQWSQDIPELTVSPSLYAKMTRHAPMRYGARIRSA